MDQTAPERPSSDRHLWQIRPIRDILTLLIVAALLWLGYAMREVTVPLLVALLLAYLFEPAVAWMTRTKWIPCGRIGAVSTLLIGGSAVVLVALVLLVPRVVTQAEQLVDEVRSGDLRNRLTKLVLEYVPGDYQSPVMRVVSELPAAAGSSDAADGVQPAPEVSVRGETNTETSVRHDLSTMSRAAHAIDTSSASVDVWGLVSRTGRIAWAVVLQLIAVGMLLFLIPFYFFYFSLWFPHVVSFCDDLLPVDSKPTVVPLLKRMDAAVAGFVRGRIVISLIMMVLLAIGWMLCGVPYAILLGVLIGGFSIVPFLGLIGVPLSIGILAMAQLDLDAAVRMSWWGIVLWPTLVFSIVQGLDGWVLTPLIAGRATNLDPVTIFVAVLAGGAVLGAYGMLIAIPIAACIKILLSDLVIPKLRMLASTPSGAS
ncbi:MAG: AI-2E family transporter [Phycisphaerales bacterium]|nr:AI-2E family transporter [Phycisphaerales bacterium]